MSRLIRCACGRETAAGAPMASHQRRCPAAAARREQIAAEEVARVERVAAATCTRCNAGPGEPCTEPGRRPGTRVPMPLPGREWAGAYHQERHNAERFARLGY